MGRVEGGGVAVGGVDMVRAVWGRKFGQCLGWRSVGVDGENGSLIRIYSKLVSIVDDFVGICNFDILTRQIQRSGKGAVRGPRTGP